MSLSSSILVRLHYQHQTIGELIGDLPEEVLRRRVNPDKWSALENIVHLATYQPVFIWRLERILEEDSPSFDRYVADQDPLFTSYIGKTLPELLQDIDKQRNLINAKLEGVNGTQLGKKGLHPKYGLLTVSQWAEFFLLHEAHHLFTIFMIVQEQRKALR